MVKLKCRLCKKIFPNSQYKINDPYYQIHEHIFDEHRNDIIEELD